MAGKGGRRKGVSQSEDSEDGGRFSKTRLISPQLPTATSKDRIHSLAHKMELIDRDRLLRLQRAAKAGDIVHTKRGVFHLTPCDECGFHHKLSLSLKKQAPCPATDVGKRYYANHPKEKLLLETFPLNKVLKARIQSMQISPRKKLISTSLPKVMKSDEKGKMEVLAKTHSAASPHRPKTSKGRLQEAGQSEGRSSKRSPAFNGVSWKDVFYEAGLSSSEASSDADSKDMQDAGTMRRQLVREMFTQEEEALRFRLAKEREKHYYDVRTLRTHEKERALNELKSKRVIEELKRRFCLLIEQEIILGVAKVTLDEYYHQYRAYIKESIQKHNQKVPGTRQKLPEDLKKEYLEYITSKESKMTEREHQIKAFDILKKKHEATPKISELKLAEVELQKKLSQEQQATYQQKVAEARQQAELQQKVQEARQLEQKLRQNDSRVIHPSMHAELHQKVSEARALHQKMSALKQTMSEQQRASNDHKFKLQQQLFQVRRLREQLSIERQSDLQKKFSESKKAELTQHVSNTEQNIALAAKQENAQQELSNARRATMGQEQLAGHESELQKILKETLILDQQGGQQKRHFQGPSKGHVSVQTILSQNFRQEMQRSRSAPRSQRWRTLPTTRNVEFAETSTKVEKKLSSEKGIQTEFSQQKARPMLYEFSSSSTPMDSSGTDDRGHYIRIGGPTTISPRPPSAHPMRRPDLYGKRPPFSRDDEDDDDDDDDDIPEWTTTHQSTTDNIPEWTTAPQSTTDVPEWTTTHQSTTTYASSSNLDARHSCPAPRGAKRESVPSTITTTTFSDSHIASRSKDSNFKKLSSKERILEQRRDDMPAVAAISDGSVGYSSSHEKKISFMVSLACGDDKRETNTTDVSVAPASSSDSMLTLTDENIEPSSKIDSSNKTVSSPHNIIDTTREASSLIGHVDSLILIEQGVPEPPHPLSAKESQEVIEKVQAESCIVQHVDSLILIEQSLHQLDESGKTKEVKKHEHLPDSLPKEEFVETELEASAPRMIPTSEVIIKKSFEEVDKKSFKRRVSISSQDKELSHRRVSISSHDQEMVLLEKSSQTAISKEGSVEGKYFMSDKGSTIVRERRSDLMVNISCIGSQAGVSHETLQISDSGSRAATGSSDGGGESGFVAPPSTPTDFQQLALKNADLSSAFDNKVNNSEAKPKAQSKESLSSLKARNSLCGTNSEASSQL